MPCRRHFNLSERELMDDPAVDTSALAAGLENLTTINHYFGGHVVCDLILEHIASGTREPALKNRELMWLDCATGAGDLPVYFSAKTGPSARFVLLDLHAGTLQISKQRAPTTGFHGSWLQGNMLKLPFGDGSFDIVTCQLALHHFSEPDAIRILQELRRVSRHWVFVSDLTRSPLARVVVWFLVQFWLRDPMTRYDARLSIRHAYTPAEFQSLAREAGWEKFHHKALPLWFRQLLWLDKTP
ncbi:MAG: methyltransferase domain-containing protein [Methylacidiphilales bacterium]|nr:methyltransferase domain-containing protein [Candidatus Methylacidiphilales bacterium]